MTTRSIPTNAIANDPVGHDSMRVDGTVVDASDAVAVVIDAPNKLVTSGAKILSVRNGGVEVFAIDKDGQGGGRVILPNGLSDSYAAIQASLDQGGVTTLGQGEFISSRPLLITQQGTVLRGQGAALTSIRSNIFETPWSGPMVCYTPNDSARKVNLGGVGMLVNPANINLQYHYLNLMDNSTASLDGATSCSVEMFAVVDADDPGGFGGYTGILQCVGNQYNPDAVKSAWSIQQFRDSGGVRYWAVGLTVGGTIYTANVGPLTTGHKTHLLIDYDGSTGNIKFFVDGVGITVASVTPGSTVNQYLLEGIYCGDGYTNGVYNSGPGFSSIKGSVGGIRVRNASLHQSDFTPPTDNPVADANTLLCLNFDREHGPLLVGTGYLPGVGGVAELYYLPRTFGQAPNDCFVQNLAINCGYGTGIFASGVKGGINGVDIESFNVGIEYYMDAFISSLSQINIDCRRFGLLYTGASDGLSPAQQINIAFGGVGIYGVTSWHDFYNVLLVPNDQAEMGSAFFNNNLFTGLNMNGLGLDIEGPTSNLKCGILISNIHWTTIRGSNIDSIPLGMNTPDAVVFAASAGDPPCVLTFDTCQFLAPDSANIIKQTGTDRGSIVLVNCRNIETSSATLSNDLTNIVSIGGEFGGRGHVVQGTP